MFFLCCMFELVSGVPEMLQETSQKTFHLQPCQMLGWLLEDSWPTDDRGHYQMTGDGYSWCLKMGALMLESKRNENQTLLNYPHKQQNAIFITPSPLISILVRILLCMVIINLNLLSMPVTNSIWNCSVQMTGLLQFILFWQK